MISIVYQEFAMSKKDPIMNEYLLPRSEYYYRFDGSSAFQMKALGYYGTYHRSESTRFFKRAGGRKKTQFMSPCLSKPEKSNSFFSHVGGVASPFSVPEYAEVLTLTEQVVESPENIHDKLLLYKRDMAAQVVSHFTEIAETNSQKIRKKGCRKQFFLRPEVFYENNYPCVLVALAVINPMVNATEAATYWAKHPKPLQRLLIASFIACVNIEAMQSNIPIEMVIRAGFGHNLPSICETDNTFRINVGLIPSEYAKLIAKALVRLDQMMQNLFDDTNTPAPFDDAFHATVRGYNARKLTGKIDGNNRYQALKKTRAYKKAKYSDDAFDKLYQAFCTINQKKGVKGRANFVAVRLRGKNLSQALYAAGDCQGKSTLAECFRENYTVDWFADVMMRKMLDKEPLPLASALCRLLGCLRYGDVVSMNYDLIHREMKKAKRQFSDLSFRAIYASDRRFSAISQRLFSALLAKRPDEKFYASLERANIALLTTSRVSEVIAEEAGYGSDSDFSDEFSQEDDVALVVAKSMKFYHKKLRVCSGMKAIVLAQYGALTYLRQHGVSEFRQDIEQMYYEVADALKMISEPTIVKNKIRAKVNDSILHYDLNHCNASNAVNNASLLDKLRQTAPSVVILDYTSSTVLEVEAAAKQCFSHENIKVVFMVESGLKHRQGGADYNPYGELRLMTREKKTRDHLMKKMQAGLSEKDKLPAKAHEMVRVCKRRGLAISLYGFFKTKRLQTVQPKDDLSARSVVSM